MVPNGSSKSKDSIALWTIEEVAQYLRVSESTVRNWIGSHDLPVVRLGPGRLIRFRKEDIDDWVRRHSDDSGKTPADDAAGKIVTGEAA